MAGDVLSLEDDDALGAPLLEPVMRGGKRLARPTLDDIRARVKRNLAALPEALRRLEPGAAYPVQISDAVVRLAGEADRRSLGKRASAS